MRTHLELPLWQGRVLVAFFTLCGGVALLFASVGLFGVTHYTIGQRTREFGIRLALGATARQVMGEVLRDGVRLAALGATVGVVAAWGAARLLAAGLYGVSPSDPTTYAAILLVQALVAVGAGLLPARRATRIDPALALRRE
jgi:ABC-type antimicrobial peptide transport system permease subunit